MPKEIEITPAMLDAYATGWAEADRQWEIIKEAMRPGVFADWPAPGMRRTAGLKALFATEDFQRQVG